MAGVGAAAAAAAVAAVAIAAHGARAAQAVTCISARAPSSSSSSSSSAAATIGGIPGAATGAAAAVGAVAALDAAADEAATRDDAPSSPVPCDAAMRGRFGDAADVDVDAAAPLAACAASATTTSVAAVADAADEAATRDDAPSSPVPRDAATRGRFGGVADVDVDDAAPLAACAASATTTSVANLDLRVGRDDDAADRDVSVAGAAAHRWLPLLISCLGSFQNDLGHSGMT